MTLLQRRIKANIVRAGEPFVRDGNTFRGVFTTVPPSAARTYFEDTVAFGLPRPLEMVHVGYDDSTVVSDIITRDGQDQTVHVVRELRAYGQVAAKLLLIGPI